MKGKQHKIYLVKRLLLGKDFLAICLFGFIQQRELLYLPFFVWYGIEWLVLLLKYRDRMEAYRHIRFEQEAYRHQHDLTYLEKRKHYHYLR